MHAISERVPRLGRSFRIRLVLAILILLALAMLSFAAAPDAAQHRDGQKAAFPVKTFGLALFGP